MGIPMQFQSSRGLVRQAEGLWPAVGPGPVYLSLHLLIDLSIYVNLCV